MTTDGAAPLARIAMVTVDTHDAVALARWWATHLGGRVEEFDGFQVLLPGRPGALTVCFQQVEDPTPGKNRVHLDLAVADVPAAVGRLLSAGATHVADHQAPSGFRWSVLADPHGNQFCVSPAPDEGTDG